MIVNICNGPVSLENSDSYREDASRRAPPPYPITASSGREQLRWVGKKFNFSESLGHRDPVDSM